MYAFLGFKIEIYKLINNGRNKRNEKFTETILNTKIAERIKNNNMIFKRYANFLEGEIP